MSRVKRIRENGFFGIGIMNNVDGLNIGTLWRSAYILGANFIFTIDKKYKSQGSDITKAWTKIPLYHYKDLEHLKTNIPYSTQLIGVEMSDESESLIDFQHPDRAIYLLGNEQIGLGPKIIEQCNAVVKLPGTFSLNVAVAGSIIMYDRLSKINKS